MFKYCGIGSRSTPPEILEQIVDIGKYMATKDWLLRSGGADGADSSFEYGCDLVKGKKEIFLPWTNFNGNDSLFSHPSKSALLLASNLYPWIKNSKGAVQNLIARNMHQVLGWLLDDPVNLVICWTPNGEEKGGTAYALKLAKSRNIRIFNLAVDQNLKDLIEEIERS